MQAALKQLPRNKVPSMAVMIKSLSRSSVDAGAVFRDPTGESPPGAHQPHPTPPGTPHNPPPRP